MDESLVAKARQGLTTVVGLGILVVQNAQVQRRELTKAAPKLAAEVSEAVGARVTMLGEKLSDFAERHGGTA